jgi:hypothetical protein
MNGPPESAVREGPGRLGRRVRYALSCLAHLRVPAAVQRGRAPTAQSIEEER